MKIGDLVRTPKVSPFDASYAVKAGLGLGYYDWEGKLGIVVGFREDIFAGNQKNNYIKVLIQDTGKLCVFSPDTLTSVE